MANDWFNELETVDDVMQLYDKLCADEAFLNDELVELLDEGIKCESKLKQLYEKMPNVPELQSEATQLANMVNFTADLATTVNSKVRRLDLSKTRVTQCLQRIGDLLDLEFCTDGIKSSLNNEDYEKAAAHIHRFLSLDESVLKRTAADISDEKTKDSNEVLNPSSMDEAFNQLHEAEVKLKQIVVKKFDESVRDDDVASVERFFKIFPLLNEHEEGLRKFSNYLSTKISDRNLVKTIPVVGGTYPTTHVEQLTQLYETIAKIVDMHQPLVETYYGPGRLVTVIEILQRECDRLAKKILNDFIAQKKLNPVKNSIQKAMNSNQSSTTTVEKIDARDVDELLTEITLVTLRSNMYFRFINKRAKGDIQIAFSEYEEEVPQRKKKLERIDNLVRNCELSRIVQEINGIYVLIEEYFLYESSSKAVQLNVIDPIGSLTSSMLDDIFFIVKKCIKRSMLTGSLDVVCAVINHSVSILATLFTDTINETFKYGYPTTSLSALDLSQAYSAIQTGRYLQSSSEIEKARALFLTAINNLDTACDYVKELSKSLNEDINKNLISDEEGQQKQQQLQKLESCLLDLVSLNAKFQSLISKGLSQICANVFKPHIKTWTNAFSSANHSLTDEEIESYETRDGLRPFTQTFILNIDVLFQSLKPLLTQSNQEYLVKIFSSELSSRFEQSVMKCSFNKLGGLQYGRELRAIINYLTSITSWSIRDKFNRLKQIATILSLESVGEVTEYFGNSSSKVKDPSRLGPTEVRSALRLRMDFSSDVIRKVKL